MSTVRSQTVGTSVGLYILTVRGTISTTPLIMDCLLTICRKYYRTLDNCYVSVNTVEDLAQKAPTIPPTSTKPTNLMQEPLPYCGPVPHLKAVNRPGLLEDSPPVVKPASKPATPLAAAGGPPPPVSKPQGTTTPTSAKSVPPNAPPVPPRSTSAIVPDEEDEDDEEESPLKLRARTVSIIRVPSASCRTCPRASCKAAERLARRQKTKVHCSTTPGSTNQFLRTANSCYVHGRDTDLSRDEGMSNLTDKMTELTFDSEKTTEMFIVEH